MANVFSILAKPTPCLEDSPCLLASAGTPEFTVRLPDLPLIPFSQQEMWIALLHLEKH